MVWVSPTAMLITCGTSLAATPPGTVKARALLQAPFCWTRTTPVRAARQRR